MSSKLRVGVAGPVENLIIDELKFGQIRIEAKSLIKFYELYNRSSNKDEIEDLKKEILSLNKFIGISRRFFAGLATASVATVLTSCGGGSSTSGTFDDTVTVGILHSLSGTMAISESTLVDTEKMAIEEINAAGGVNVGGKSYKIEYIVEDGASDWPTFAEKSKKLIDQDGGTGFQL